MLYMLYLCLTEHNMTTWPVYISHCRLAVLGMATCLLLCTAVEVLPVQLWAIQVIRPTVIQQDFMLNADLIVAREWIRFLFMSKKKFGSLYKRLDNFKLSIINLFGFLIQYNSMIRITAEITCYFWLQSIKSLKSVVVVKTPGENTTILHIHVGIQDGLIAATSKSWLIS